jgi:hypothetical protein
MVLPEFMGMRSINETTNSVLKRTQIHFLRSKKEVMKKREFGWQIILYNIKRKIKISNSGINQTFFIQVYGFVLSGQSLQIVRFKNMDV